MSYQEILEEVLLSLDEGEQMKGTISRIRAKSKTRKHDKTIIKDIERFIKDESNPFIHSAVYDRGQKDWIHRSDIFSDMAFLIRLNDYERDNKTLVLGHRIVPFMDISNVNSGDVKLFTEAGDELPCSREELDFEIVSPFILFTPPYTTDSFMSFGESGIELDTYDLTLFFKETNFGKNDLLEFIPKDWKQHEFIVRKKTETDFKREGIVLNGKKNMLENALKEVLAEMHMGGSLLDYALFHAFANCKAKMNNYAGSPIAEVINNWGIEERFHIDNTTGMIMIFLENPMNMINLGDYGGDFMTIGMDDSLDGILQEVGNSYDGNFVLVNYVLQLHKNGEINTDAVMDILFENRNNTFFVDSQEKKLRERMKEMAADVKKEWKDIRLSPEKQQFLKTGLQAKQKIINILRGLDNRLIMPEELDLHKMQPLMEMESMVDGLFQIVEGAKDIPGVLAKQFREPFKELLTMIDELEKNILADFD